MIGNARARRILLSFGVLAALAGFDAPRWWQAERINAAIDRSVVAGEPSNALPVGNDAPAELRFAAALAAAREGQVTRAVALYRQVAEARPDLAPTALLNAGNTLQREGRRLAAEDNRTGALPMLELAKETYREVLRIDPGQWSARYNLERALRLAPEDETVDEGSASMPTDAERAITTMRSFTLGLP
jgi:mxaK protein